MLEKLITLFLATFVAMMGGAGFLWSIARLRSLLFSTQFKPQRQGRMRLRGKAWPIDPKALQTTPLTHTSCIAYTFLITEAKSSAKGGTTSVILYSEYKGGGNLSIRHGQERIRIGTKELDLNIAHFQDQQHLFADFRDARSLEVLTQKKINPKLMGIKRSLTITECIIRPGDQINVFGQIKNQPLVLENSIVTDKSITRFMLESGLVCLVSMWFLKIALALFDYALR